MSQWGEDTQISYTIEANWLDDRSTSDRAASIKPIATIGGVSQGKVGGQKPGDGDTPSTRVDDCSPTPRCFTDQQWLDWRAAAETLERARGDSRLQAGHCTDCTREYQQEMVRAGRCGHPEVVFVMVTRNRDRADYAIEGRWPKSEK